MKREGTCWSGSLGRDEFPPLLLSRIHLQKMTGDLILRKEVSRYTFHLVDGTLKGCTNGTPGGSPVGDAVQEVFHWGEGTYSFMLSLDRDSEAADRQDTADLILAGVRGIRNLYLVEQALGRPEGWIRLAKNQPTDTAFQFSPLESYLLSKLGGRRTVEELCRLSQVTRPEALRGIYALLCAGVVEGGGDPLLAEPQNVKPRYAFDSTRFGAAALSANPGWGEDVELMVDTPQDSGTVVDGGETAGQMARHHFERGLEQFAGGDYTSAVQLFRLATKIDDHQAVYHRHLALALSRSPRGGRRAEQALLRAVELEPDHAETHYFLGRIYLDSGLPARAMARFRESLRINPELKAARLELAVMNGAARGGERQPVPISLFNRT